MRWPRRWLRRLRGLVRKDRLEREMDEEMRFHVEMEAEELQRIEGLTEREARRRALVAFGGVEQTKERARHTRGLAAVDALAGDVRYAGRVLRRRPGFSVVATATLALGIGATTVLFSVADHVLIRPLPHTDADRVVTLWRTERAAGASRQPVSPGNFVHWRERSRSFEALGLAEPYGFDLTGEHPPESVEAWIVTDGFLDALGVRPILGRGFVAADFEVDAPRVVLLSHAIWKQRWNGDAAIVGSTVELDGAPATVIGVMPPWLEYPEPTGLWAPKRIRPRESEDRTSAYMMAVGRLRPGVTVERARRELDRIAAELAREYPATNEGVGVRAVPLADQIRGPVRPALLVLLAAVGCLLLIACANVASLVIARGAEREHEIGVRAALGAGRRRLVRQLLTESLALGLLGGLAGAATAWAGLEAFLALGPPDLPRMGAIALDARVLAFAVGLTVVVTLAFGLVPALRLSDARPLGVLRGARTVIGAGGTGRTRGGLVVAQIALAFVLLAGAALLGRSFLRVLENDLGFETERRVALQLFLWDRGRTAAERLQRIAEIEERLESVPGVEAVGLTSALPFHPHRIETEQRPVIEGLPGPPGQRPSVQASIASADYSRVMGIPLIAGRGFTDRDRAETAPVALVNQAFVRRVLGGADAIGRRVTVAVMGSPVTREIVGVVGDVRTRSLESEAAPEIYIPHTQSVAGSMTFVVRTRIDPSAVVATLRERVWEVDPRQTIYHTATVAELVGLTLAGRRFHLALLATLSGLALVLATIGLYGVVSYTTRRRFPEIGLRLALGARPAGIARLVLGDGLRLGVPGVALGLAGALLATRWMEPMLYDVDPTDPTTLVLTGAVLLVAVAVGAYAPARRASSMDPATTLRAGS